MRGILMKFIYDKEYYKNIKTNKKIELYITVFIKKHFPIYCDDLKVLELLDDASKEFGPQVNGVAIPGELKIRLKYNLFKSIVEGKCNIERKKQALCTMYHEMQHIVNYLELKHFFDLIDSGNQSRYIKHGIKNLLA